MQAAPDALSSASGHHHDHVVQGCELQDGQTRPCCTTYRLASHIYNWMHIPGRAYSSEFTGSGVGVLTCEALDGLYGILSAYDIAGCHCTNQNLQAAIGLERSMAGKVGRQAIEQLDGLLCHHSRSGRRHI